jgi:tRNA 2-selenouridine synthase
MAGRLEINDFYKSWKESDSALIDVRSPGEFSHAHIPGAVNIPLFENEERAEVGTLYKQVSRDEAYLKGLEIVGPKMRHFVEKAREVNPGKTIHIHCWRGGMRSQSMGWLFENSGFEVNTLVGGYKAYRNKVLESFKQPLPLLVLGGKTGTGKTIMLHGLQEVGEQIIDLEGLANHKGSSFGAMGEDPQPSTEHFQNLLFEEIQKLDLNRRIWIEDESIHIGKVMIPNDFFKQKEKASVIAVEIPTEKRLDHLVEVYAHFDKEELKAAVERIEKRLGGLATKNALEALDDENYRKTAEICLNYYDKTYTFGLKHKPKNCVKELFLEDNNPEFSARKLIEFANQSVGA